MKPTSILLAFIMLVATYNLHAQTEECKVLLPELTGKYSGKCKKGLAHGNGTAEGKDRYEGKFKDGLPDGYGTYSNSDGEVYEGYFNEGKRHGQGKLKTKINGKDSTYNGIWKNGEFVKLVQPVAYNILRIINVNRHTVHRVNNGARVLFSLTQNGVPNNGVANLLMISDSGTYVEIGNKKGFENVVFPFLCKVTYVTPNAIKTQIYEVTFEITVNNPGDWLITLSN